MLVLIIITLFFNIDAADTTTYFDPEFIEYVLTQDSFANASHDELDKVRECLATQTDLAEKNREEKNQGALNAERTCFMCLPIATANFGVLLPTLYPQIFTIRAVSGCLIGGCMSIPCCVAGLYYAHHKEFQELNKIKAQIAVYNAEVCKRNTQTMLE